MLKKHVQVPGISGILRHTQTNSEDRYRGLLVLSNLSERTPEKGARDDKGAGNQLAYWTYESS